MEIHQKRNIFHCGPFFCIPRIQTLFSILRFSTAGCKDRKISKISQNLLESVEFGSRSLISVKIHKKIFFLKPGFFFSTVNPYLINKKRGGDPPCLFSRFGKKSLCNEKAQYYFFLQKSCFFPFVNPYLITKKLAV